MAKIVNPTNGVVRTPLLIEETHLFALDKVFDDFVADRMHESKEAADEVEGTGPKNHFRQKRSVVIYLSAGRTVKSDCFADAIKQPHVGTEEPLGFRADLESGHIKASVSLTKLARQLVRAVSPAQFQGSGRAAAA